MGRDHLPGERLGHLLDPHLFRFFSLVASSNLSVIRSTRPGHNFDTDIYHSPRLNARLQACRFGDDDSIVFVHYRSELRTFLHAILLGDIRIYSFRLLQLIT